MNRNEIFDCEKCGSPDDGGGIGGWSVHTTLWNEVMMANGAKMGKYSAKGMLCIPCFEKLLGRKLVACDFPMEFLDNQTNSNVQRIINEISR